MTTSLQAESDVLLGFWQQTLTLRPDDEGEVVATLVGKTSSPPSRRAVLYVHGYVDYFFQAHLADAYVAHGIDFYALDLRKHGRSLRPHQTPNFCRSVDEYFEELDAAVEIVRANGHQQVLLSGHSTGGLTTALYAHERRGSGTIQGIFLNSPFFEFNAGWLARRAALPALARLGKDEPYHATPVRLSPLYGESLHANYRGSWDFNLEWKPVAGFLPVAAGWVRAIHDGHQRLQAGLEVDCPVLVMCSAHSVRADEWDDALYSADAVLDADDISRRAELLGPDVTRIRIEGGMHDLVLSAPPVREHVLDELFRWCRAYF